MTNRTDRRSFLYRTGVRLSALCAPAIVPASALGRHGKPGPNDRVEVGIIGLGPRAKDVARTCLGIPQMRIRAICDCFAPRCTAFQKAFGRKWPAYEDFREMIDREKLDGVMIETTTHARAWIAIQAMQAELDTYIEKPMCLTIAEGRAMVRAARKYGVVTQVGTQQRSMPINNWASDLVKNGAIGKIRVVLAPNFVGPEPWTSQPAQPLPSGGRKGWWELWTSQAPLAPLPPAHPLRLVALVGLRRRWTVLRRHRLGHPCVRPDPTRSRHGRNRPGGSVVDRTGPTDAIG